MKCYSPRAIDIIAQNTLKNFNPIFVGGEPQQVPIEEIIELHLGINLEYARLSKNGTIHGITVFEDTVLPLYDEQNKDYALFLIEENTIIIDSKLLAANRVKRLRFTLAHELAHWIIHQEYYVNSENIASKMSTQSDARTEREADELAAALLIPYGRLKVAYKRLCGKLNQKTLISQLATMFNVSAEAMTIRLSRLGL